MSVGTVHGAAPTWIDVNEVRFDKQVTEVLDDDDRPTTVEALKLGMQVDIAGDHRFVKDGKAVDIESIVTEFTSIAAFKWFGLPVDASKAAFVNQAELKLGATNQSLSSGLS